MDVDKYIKRVTEPIFKEVLKETAKNPMLVGKGDTKTPQFTYIQMHNYRRWYDYDSTNFKLITDPHELRNQGYRCLNYGSEHFFKDFMGCGVRVRKNTIQVTNKIEHRRWHSIDIYRAYDDVREIVKQKEIECIGVLEAFIKRFGGESQFNLINYTQEVKIQGNAITDRLNEKLTWHTKDHKKVYKKKLVEVYDISKAVRLIDNSVLYENIPEIAEPLRVLSRAVLDLRLDAQKPLKNPFLVKDIIKYIKKTEHVAEMLPHYLELEWEDRIMVCEHVRGLM